jgi:DNA-binding response OmpR family regulator
VDRTQNSVPAILIADDDELIRLVIFRALSSRGYAVAVATTRQESVDMWAATRFDLFIVDVHMPDLSLEDSLTLMAKERPLPRVLVISGENERPSGLRAELAYLRKPFNLLEFLNEVARLLDRGEPDSLPAESTAS